MGCMVGPGGLEPPTPRLSSACSNQLSYEPIVCVVGSIRIDATGNGGADRVRTGDLLLAKQALFQLSYDPGEIYSAIKNRTPGSGKLYCAISSGRPASFCFGSTRSGTDRCFDLGSMAEAILPFSLERR